MRLVTSQESELPSLRETFYSQRESLVEVVEVLEEEEPSEQRQQNFETMRIVMFRNLVRLAYCTIADEQG